MSAKSDYVRERKAKMLAERVEIGGRLVHPRAPHGDGTSNGYGNYGCRCLPCTTAWTDASYERNHRRPTGT